MTKKPLPAGEHFKKQAVYSAQHEKMLRLFAEEHGLDLVSYGSKDEEAFHPTSPEEVAEWKKHIQAEGKKGTTKRPDCLLLPKEAGAPALDKTENSQADRWVNDAECAVEIKSSAILFNKELNFTLPPDSLEEMVEWKATHQKPVYIVQSFGDQVWQIELDDFLRAGPRRAAIGGVENYLVRVTEGEKIGDVEGASYTITDKDKGKIDKESYVGGVIRGELPKKWRGK